MTLGRQLSSQEEAEEQRSSDDGMENLRQFMAILQEWDREDRHQLQEQRGRSLVDRCFTDDMESD